MQQAGDERGRRRDWAEQAEVDYASIVPRAFFPWWGNLIFGALLAAALHLCEPPALALPIALLVSMLVCGMGAWVRRGPKPTLARTWTAVILAISGFLVVLAVFVNDDTLLPTVLWSFTAAGLVYLATMALRRETLGLGRSARR